MMVCSCHYSCLHLTLKIVDFKLEFCPWRLHHVCQGWYLLFNYIDFDGAKRKICRNFVGKLRGRGKSETLNKVGDINVYGMDEEEDD